MIRKSNFARCLATLGGVGLLVAGLASPAGAANFQIGGGAASPDAVADLSEADAGNTKYLSLPAVPDDMLQFASDTQVKYADDPSFSAVEISPDRTELSIWWHGAVPNELRATAEAARYDVTFEPTALSPGALRDAASRAVSDPSLGITSAGPLKDGSGLTVTVADRPQARGAVSLESVLGVPVEVAGTEAPIAARQNDIYGLGGARVYRWNGSGLAGSCSTGFAVQKGSQQGMLFANHCGGVGTQHVRWPNNDGANVYYYGNDGVVKDVSGAHDAAVMGMNSNIGAIYTGAYTNTSGIVIAGAISPPIGSEICYSGSYSGFICGNIVAEANISYTLAVSGGNINVTTGIRTEEINNRPAVGNGDSGGPGVLINSSGQLLAGTIISAIPGNSGTTCNGVPGDGNRKCSKTVFSTPVVGALYSTGWSIRTGN